jgi:hypothetical protein
MKRINLKDILPPVRSFEPWPGPTTGTDLYGAFHVAADYCGLQDIPKIFPGIWQHGCIPPWQQIQPEMVIYCAPRTARCWVARKDEEIYLRQAGYKDVTAIGLPILYTKPSGARRIPNSVLIMPTHCIPGDTRASDNEAYVAEVTRATQEFDFRAACVSGRCIATGLWAPRFEQASIEVIRGSSIDDANSLERMRTLFETFEYVTTDMYGSHVPYALYFGAKVSVWGPWTPSTREYLMRDDLWSRFPDAIDRLVSTATREKAEALLGRFRVKPEEGISDDKFGGWMLGAENKLSPRALRQTFGWDIVGRSLEKLRSQVQLCRDRLALRRRWRRLLGRQLQTEL